MERFRDLASLEARVAPDAARSAPQAAVLHPAPEDPARAVLIVGGSRAARVRAAIDHLRARGPTGAVVCHDPDPDGWPFRVPVADGLPPAGPVIVVVHDLERAFPSQQTNTTRLVLTQSTYLVQKWLDALAGRPGSALVATADEVALRVVSPETFARRGPWSRCLLLRLDEVRLKPDTTGNALDAPAGAGARTSGEAGVQPPAARDQDALLRFAYATRPPLARLDACRRAAELAPGSAVAHLALASACMEHEDLEGAGAALDRAASLAPDWEAVHFERGKLWLRLDDMARASEAFARACELMPTFSASFSNLGATLGELDRPVEGLAAFEQALRHDPCGHQILSNIGVVNRELGRLKESEAAFRRVIELAPDFVFGYYNLGHTLFLQLRFADALAAYVEGQRRDPQRNARQASRLALTRLAAGDPDGALRDLRRCLAGLPDEAKPDVLGEAQDITAALMARTPDLAGGPEVVALIDAELARLG